MWLQFNTSITVSGVNLTSQNCARGFCAVQSRAAMPHAHLGEGWRRAGLIGVYHNLMAGLITTFRQHLHITELTSPATVREEDYGRGIGQKARWSFSCKGMGVQQNSVVNQSSRTAATISLQCSCTMSLTTRRPVTLLIFVCSIVLGTVPAQYALVGLLTSDIKHSARITVYFRRDIWFLVLGS